MIFFIYVYCSWFFARLPSYFFALRFNTRRSLLYVIHASVSLVVDVSLLTLSFLCPSGSRFELLVSLLRSPTCHVGWDTLDEPLSPRATSMRRHGVCPLSQQSRSQSFVPLGQRSENESSRSIYFEITTGNNQILVIQSRWEQPFQACAIACHKCTLRLRSEPDNQNSVISYCSVLLFQNGCSQSSRFPTAGQGE